MGFGSQILDCFCSPACSLFCSMMSVFGIFIMLMLGVLIGSGYEYVGAWTEEALKSDSKAQAEAAKACYQVALIWVVFLGLSLVCCVANRRKTSGSAPRVVRY
mmetsp:Transcript_39938/g.55525  ORF Transcript_39938/g.55525 Transcript_39938/m.55525 type:complete len:103 (+) Transcript_39938:239-547(+)